MVYHSEIFKPMVPVKVTDPNTFQIKNSLKLESKDIGFLFEDLSDLTIDVINELGWGLEVKKTTIRHQAAHNGVFLRLKNSAPLKAGSIVGFVPGVYRVAKTSNYRLDEDLIYRPNGYKFNMKSLMPYPNDNLSSIEEINEIFQSHE